jgi:hypothetical protein
LNSRIEKQKKIVSEIDSIFSNIDAAIISTAKVIVDLKKIKKEPNDKDIKISEINIELQITIQEKHKQKLEELKKLVLTGFFAVEDNAENTPTANLQNILTVILENPDFVRQKHTGFVKNYKRKIQDETYDEHLAKKGLDHYIPDAIKVYNTLTDSNIRLDKQGKEMFKGIILKKILEDIGK